MTVAFSDDFTGTNGDPWNSANWNAHEGTTGAVSDILTNMGRMLTGTVGAYAAYSRRMGKISCSDFEVTFDVIVTTAETFNYFGFRSDGTWWTGNPIPANGYFLEIVAINSDVYLERTIASSSTILAQDLAYTMLEGDTLHWRIRVAGSNIKVRLWKNAESEPVTWKWDVNDATYASGVFSCGFKGGNDTVSDTSYFDNILASSLAAPLPLRIAR